MIRSGGPRGAEEPERGHLIQSGTVRAEWGGASLRFISATQPFALVRRGANETGRVPFDDDVPEPCRGGCSTHGSSPFPLLSTR